MSSLAGASPAVPRDPRLLLAEQADYEARKAAAKIASQSPLAVMANKELVNAAFETTLAQGLQFERRLFHSLFAFDDQKEGMSCFLSREKPKPKAVFTNN